MKNKYTLSQLDAIEQITDTETKSHIFFKMRNLCMNTHERELESIDSFEALRAMLTDSAYFFAHDCLWVKGKQQRFIGELVIATGPSIVKFLESAIEQKDVRGFLVTQVFDEEPDCVIHIYDDESFWMFRRKIH